MDIKSTYDVVIDLTCNESEDLLIDENGIGSFYSFVLSVSENLEFHNFHEILLEFSDFGDHTTTSATLQCCPISHEDMILEFKFRLSDKIVSKLKDEDNIMYLTTEDVPSEDYFKDKVGFWTSSSVDIDDLHFETCGEALHYIWDRLDSINSIN